MTINTSISEFRQHISDYLEKAQDGHTVVLKDEKKNRAIAQLVGTKQFNPESFGKALNAAAGIFTAENHPEWRTKNDVIKWLSHERLKDERKF